MRPPLAACWLALAWGLAVACAPAQDAPRESVAEGVAPATSQALPPPREDVLTPRKAMLVGSWAPDDVADFDQAWLDEQGLREVYTLERASRRIWKGFTTDSETLPLDILVRDRAGPAVAYVYVLAFRDDGTLAFPDAEAVLHVRHRGRVQARYDGALVIDAPAPPAGEWNEARARVTMTESYDVVLLKLGRGSPELGDSMDVQVRLSAPDGTPIPTQGWYTMRPPGRPSDLVPRDQWVMEPLPSPPGDAEPADG